METELKIPVADLDRLRAALEEAGALRQRSRHRERNLVFDDGEGTLRRHGVLLRLRTVGGRHLLTLKGPARFRGPIKERREVELEVEDSQAMAAVLSELGYEPVARYEKDREDWLLEGVVVSLDHTPMGEFVELEGERTTLADVAAALGLDPAGAVASSYLGLWQEHRRRHPELGLPEDMVFER